MNTREFVKIGEDEQNIVFNEIDKEDELLFRKYMEASRHFQEIFQLYKMMLFNLEELLEHYDMQFDDRVYSKHGEKVDAIEINALVSNAVSSARTLIESMDVFDKVYIDKETSVYKGYKQDKIEMRGDRAEMSDFPLYLNTVAGGLDRRDQTIGGFSFVVKIYALPVVEIIG